MMKSYTLYIVNSKNGFAKDLSIQAKSPEHARHLFEKVYKRENEFVMCIYPSEFNKWNQILNYQKLL